MINKNILILIHYPNKIHYETHIEYGQSLNNIIRILKGNVLKNYLKKENLFLEGIVLVDGIRVYKNSLKLIPKSTVIIYFANKLFVDKNFLPKPEIQKIQNCSICTCNNKLVYYENNSKKLFCIKCFLEWIQNGVFSILDKQVKNNNIKSLLIGLSGERDSTVALHLIMQYFNKERLLIPIYALFIHHGQKPYRDICQKSVENLVMKFKLNLEIIQLKQFIKQYNKKINASNHPVSEKNLSEIFTKLPDRFKNRICNACTYTADLVFQEFREKAGENTWVITGITLSDIFRQLFRKNEGILDNYLYPLISFTDEEIGLYAALNDINYVVEDCPFNDFSYLYEINKKRQLINMVLPGSNRELIKINYQNFLDKLEK